MDLVLYETPDSEYGDYLVKQQTTKEEREKKVAMPILGNGRRWDKGTGGRSQAPRPDDKYDALDGKRPPDDVPF